MAIQSLTRKLQAVQVSNLDVKKMRYNVVKDVRDSNLEVSGRGCINILSNHYDYDIRIRDNSTGRDVSYFGFAKPRVQELLRKELEIITDARENMYIFLNSVAEGEV